MSNSPRGGVLGFRVPRGDDAVSAFGTCVTDSNMANRFDVSLRDEEAVCFFRGGLFFSATPFAVRSGELVEVVCSFCWIADCFFVTAAAGLFLRGLLFFGGEAELLRVTGFLSPPPVFGGGSSFDEASVDTFSSVDRLSWLLLDTEAEALFCFRCDFSFARPLNTAAALQVDVLRRFVVFVFSSVFSSSFPLLHESGRT